MKKIYFDLDGTLFDFYGQTDWLNKLENSITGLFTGESLKNNGFFFNRAKFLCAITELKNLGFEFGVISWLSKSGTQDYNEICKQEKIKWINKNLPFINDINIVPYGTPKQNVVKRNKLMILIDDNIDVCNSWQTRSQRLVYNVNQYYTALDVLNDIIESA